MRLQSAPSLHIHHPEKRPSFGRATSAFGDSNRDRLTALWRAASVSPTPNEEAGVMHVRVVRFTGVNAERMQQMESRVREAGGPPPGVRSIGLEVLFDESQGTAVVLQRFASEQDMDDGAKIFDAMDAGETPGTRASVDACEQALELEP
jgi:hypothetical protein